MLFQLVAQSGAHTVAVVGLAKNAGKTVALNSLVAQAAHAQVTLGLTSLGYDGEPVDRLTRQAKPRIFAPAGTIIATAAGILERASASLELLRITAHSTVLGPVVLARVREPGTVELAGPAALADLQQVAEAMLAYGAAQVIIDGALNRVGAAAPRVSQATILATGASVAASSVQVIARTLHAVGLLTAKPPSQAVVDAARAAFAAERVGYWHCERGAWQSAQATALGQPAQLMAELGTASHLCVPGAVTNSLIQALLQAVPANVAPPTLVVPAGTHVFASPAVWQRYLARGGRLAALEAAPVLAVTVNPTSPTGRLATATNLGQALAKALHPLPVYDLFHDEQNPIEP